MTNQLIIINFSSHSVDKVLSLDRLNKCYYYQTIVFTLILITTWMHNCLYPFPSLLDTSHRLKQWAIVSSRVNAWSFGSLRVALVGIQQYSSFVIYLIATHQNHEIVRTDFDPSIAFDSN